MRKLNLLKLAGFFVLSFLLFACDDDTESGAYSDGIYITNEGSYGNDNGSLSFYNYGADAVTNNVYKTVNEVALGDVVQSMTIDGDKGYIVVNNSNKVEVIDKNTGENISTITDVSYPRQIVINNNKGYVTCQGDNSVKIIDLDSYSVTNSISVGSSPEGLVIANNNLYVANSGYGYDSTICVIDLDSEEVTDTISLPYKYPTNLVTDDDGNVWALCYGCITYTDDYTSIVSETPSALCEINYSENTILSYKLFDDAHPTYLYKDNDGTTFYLGGGYGFTGIYKVTVDDSEATMEKIIDTYAYGFAYDATSDVLFLGIATDFTKAGSLYRYSTDGTKLGEYTVGIGPNGAAH